MEIVLSKHLDLGNGKVELALSDHVEEAIESLHLLPPKNARFDVSFINLPLSNEKLLSSIFFGTNFGIESDHLKYVFFGERTHYQLSLQKNSHFCKKRDLSGCLESIK